MTERFRDTLVQRADRYALGDDQQTGRRYLSIPVANRLVAYEEYYALGEDEYAIFADDQSQARAFAEQCRRREHDDRLILQPGSDRGTAC